MSKATLNKTTKSKQASSKQKQESITITRLTKDERETLFRINEDNVCLADTTIPKDMNRLQKQGWEVTSTQYYSDGKVMAMTFKAPRKALAIGKAVKTKRIMTDEQKLNAAERMKNMQAKAAEKRNQKLD